MLTIVPGTCGDDNRVVSKNVQWGTPINCSVYHECSIMNPIFLLEYSSSLVNYNYLKVQSWGRYYYIVDITVAPGGRIYLTCSEDVLMSNKDEILSLKAYLIRSENKSNKLLKDNSFPVQTNRQLETYTFNRSPFTANYASDITYVLTVIGGDHS